MCPVCIASATTIAGTFAANAASTTGIVALVLNTLGVKRRTKNPDPSLKEKEK
jgi:hypothetical protein